uniref:Uncharacterized protein n=1 Tax=Anopheles dirus TaxID=7168 RepID=A0A182NG65_9DIPT
MKHQQVVPDYAAMVKTSGMCLCLVFSGWVLFKLVQAIFWLPGYLEKNQEQLYRRMEQRSGTPAKGGDRTGETKLKRRESKDEKADLDRCDEAEDGNATTTEEKGENDAVECEADSKKDK